MDEGRFKTVHSGVGVEVAERHDGSAALKDSTSQHELLQVGWIVRAHGLRGEIEVKLAWSDSSALETARQLRLRATGGEEQAFHLVSVRRGPKCFIVRLEGVEDRSRAEPLRGAAVYVERQELEPLRPDEYYLSDVVGLQVVRGGQRLGVVLDTVSYPSVDVAVVGLDGGGDAQLLLLEDGSVRVDVEAERIEVAEHVSLLDPATGEPLS